MMPPNLNPDPRAVAIAVGIVAVALAVACAYLIRELTDTARRLDATDVAAGEWRAKYYTAAHDREDLIRRNSQLTSALQLTTDLAGELRHAEDDAVIEELERQFRDHS